MIVVLFSDTRSKIFKQGSEQDETSLKSTRNCWDWSFSMAAVGCTFVWSLSYSPPLNSIIWHLLDTDSGTGREHAVVWSREMSIILNSLTWIWNQTIPGSRFSLSLFWAGGAKKRDAFGLHLSENSTRLIASVHCRLSAKLYRAKILGRLSCSSGPPCGEFRMWRNLREKLHFYNCNQ